LQVSEKERGRESERRGNIERVRKNKRVSVVRILKTNTG